MTFRIDHVSMTVANLDKSTTFYCDGLGFEFIHDGLSSSDPADAARGAMIIDAEGLIPAEVIGPRSENAFFATSRWLRKGDFSLVLNSIAQPKVSLRAPRARQDFGFSNWAFAVEDEDIEEAAERLCRLGGKRIKEWELHFLVEDQPVNIIAVLDPDGELIELTQSGGK